MLANGKDSKTDNTLLGMLGERGQVARGGANALAFPESHLTICSQSLEVISVSTIW